MIVSTALMIWKGLMVVTGSESPIVVVLRFVGQKKNAAPVYLKKRRNFSLISFINSGSMEPAFHRGDLLILTHDRSEPIRVGDIVVFKIVDRDIPIVHRVLKVHEKEDGTLKFLTKGDNNSVDDRGLYAPGQYWLEQKDVIGRAKGFVPYIGIVTILMNDYPQLKVNA